MYKIVRSSRLYEQIVQQVEESIHKGAMKPGDQLPPERELAQQFGVSRTAVREAVKALHEKGLLDAYPGRGTFVTDSTWMLKVGQTEGSGYLAEVREILEPEIAAMAATRVDEEDLASMREQIAIMDSARKDPEAFIEADLDFHLALAEAAANPLILSLIDSIVGLLREQRMGIFQVEGGPERGQYHHKRIFEAIEHRDPAGAREAMKGHLRQVREDSRRTPSGEEGFMAKLGFVGLGVMGSEMVNRLLGKGHTVTGYNRTRSKAEWLVKKGMKWADSPRAVVAASDFAFSMVTNSAALGAVMHGPDGMLAGVTPGKIFVDMSTVSPAYSREVAAKVREKGGDMVDSPVSGSVITLQEGKLSVMVGGRKETFEKVKPLLLDIGPKVTHVGDNGLALVMKIGTNLSLAVQMLAFSEGVLLAEKSGIARETAVDVLTHSVIASPMVQYRGPFILKRPEEAWFNVNMMQKDMNLALELGRQLDVPMPTTAITNEFLTAARGMGLVEKDFAVLFDVLAQMSGVKP